MTFDALIDRRPPRRITSTEPALGAPTFVVQRRVNVPLDAVQRGLADRTPLVATRRVVLGTAGYAVMHEPLRPVAPFSSYQPIPTWCGPALLLSPRGSRVARVDVEVSMWSPDATCIIVRPVARHPERWSRTRLRHYFALAHATADVVGGVIARRAFATVRATTVATDDTDRVAVWAGRAG
jgi:hypothetical protein